MIGSIMAKLKNEGAGGGFQQPADPLGFPAAVLGKEEKH
jgi:hypothetical protein